MKQAEIMMASEGNAWYARNRDALGQRDPVSDLIEHVGIKPQSVLEVGCSNGWRLSKLRDKYACKVLGIEPSKEAAIEAAEQRIPVWQATADAIPVVAQHYDLIIYGFNLYLTDPSDWLKIAAEGDRLLQNGGHIVIHDFDGRTPFARKYEHCEGVLSYHVDFPAFWLAHPFYRELTRSSVGGGEIVSVLRKDAVIKVMP